MSTRHTAVNGTASSTEGVGTDATDTETVAPEGTTRATAVAAPETLVVAEPPPTPDYPRYRVEPGTRLRLSEVDPNESEQYQGKKDIKDALGTQVARIRDLQARLYAERKQSLLIVLQAMDTGARTERSVASSRGSTRRGARSGPSRPQAPRSWSTTSCGAITRRRHRGA